MKKFIVLYHAPVDAVKQTANATPEQQAKGMEMWMQWAKSCGDKLVDLGSPLTNSQRLMPGGKSKNGDSDIVGYSILEAENMDEAKSAAARTVRGLLLKIIHVVTPRTPERKCNTTLRLPTPFLHSAA